MESKSLKIGYVVKRFPRVSEAFIANEIRELEREGVTIQIYAFVDPLAEEGSTVVHGVVRELAAEVTYIPTRQTMKRWPVKQGCFGAGEFVERPWREPHAAAVVSESTDFLQAGFVATLARADGVQHLHAHFAAEAATIACHASRLTGIPYSFTAHAKDVFHRNVDRDWLRQKIREARFVATVSDYNRRHLSALVGDGIAARIVRIYNGIDLQRFHFDSSTRELDLVFAAGRLVEKKGFRHLIEACRLLRDRGQKFRCRIMGDGPEQAALLAQIQACGLEDRVTLVAAQTQEQLMNELRRATVFVLPCVVGADGDQDALPTVLLEAQAVGLPTISTDLSGIPEIVEHEKTGLLIPPGDPSRLAAALEELLGNASLRDRLARAGRLKAEHRFDVRKNVPMLRRLFEQSAAGAEISIERAAA